MSTAHPPGARTPGPYGVSVTAADVGARVVVRRRLAGDLLGDLLGELRRWDDQVVVRDRHGVEHEVARADVVAAKRVPPAPVRPVRPTRARFAEVVRSEPVDVGLACLLVGGEVRPDLDVDESLEQLDVMAAQARSLTTSRRPDDVAEAVRRVLHTGHRLHGTPSDFDDVRASLLDEVLVRRRALPILMSVVWTEVAARLGVQACALGFPGRVLVLVGEPEDEHVVVDPWEGGRVLDRDEVAERAQGSPLVPLPANDLLLRLLTNVRVLAARRPPGLDAAAMRLWAVELSLLLPRHPAFLRRERGELLVRLGDHLGGAEELETYALVVDGADGSAAEAARREARLARAQLN